MKEETIFRKRLLELLSEYRNSIYVFPLSDRWVSGYPDILLLWKPGKCFFIEAKSLTGKLRPIQKYYKKIIQEYEIPYYQLKTIDEAKEMLNELHIFKD